MGRISLLSPHALLLWVGMYALENTATSRHLYGLSSCRGRPSTVSSERDSGVLPTLSCGFILSGLAGINCQLESFCRFLFSGACNSLLPLVPVCCTAGRLEQQQAVQLWCVLSSLQASRLCWVLSVLWGRCYRHQSLGQLPEKLEHWTRAPTLPFLRERWGVGEFLPLILHWAAGRGNGEWVCASLNHSLPLLSAATSEVPLSVSA